MATFNTTAYDNSKVFSGTNTVTIGSSKNKKDKILVEKNAVEEEKISSAIQETGESPDDSDFIYEIKHGFVAVICNTRFPKLSENSAAVAEKDRESLQSFFGETLNFEFRVYENLSADEMREKLKDISEKDFAKYDAFFAFILSYENKDGVLGTDGESVSIDSLTSNFTSKNCPSLTNKPKIFVVQCFRRDENDSGEYSSVQTTPLENDFLLAHCSPPRSLLTGKEEKSGSYFIQTLMEVLIGYRDKEHFMDLLLRVNYKIAKQKISNELMTMPRQNNCFIKKCFLFKEA